MSAVHLPAEDVRQQMRKALRGEVQVTIKPGTDTWDDTYAGNVEFLFGDWEIMVFNDCDSFDYVDSATASDGRAGAYESWAQEELPATSPYYGMSNNPDAGWSDEEIRALVALFQKAVVS